MLKTDVPLSGMEAASVRLTASASNIANANSDGTLPAEDGSIPAGAQPAYQPVQIEQSSGPGGITVATVRNVSPSYVAAYDPEASYANEQGLVAKPNVGLENDMLNLVMAKADFSLNAVSLSDIDEMVKKLYDLGS
jgi:flagellar basal-body rod protein FlgC